MLPPHGNPFVTNDSRFDDFDAEIYILSTEARRIAIQRCGTDQPPPASEIVAHEEEDHADAAVAETVLTPEEIAGIESACPVSHLHSQHRPSLTCFARLA